MSLLSQLSHEKKQKVDNIVGGLVYLKNFVMNPVAGMRALPQWDWQTLLSLLVILAVFFGALSGIISLRITAAIRGAVIYPIGCFIVISVVALFFHYTFLFFFREQTDFQKMYTISFLACIPWVVAGPFVSYLPPLNPIAVILSGVLSIVGFSENTKVARKDIAKIVVTVVGLFLAFWIVNMIRFSHESRGSRDMITPESLDILERELQDSTNAQ